MEKTWDVLIDYQRGRRTGPVCLSVGGRNVEVKDIDRESFAFYLGTYRSEDDEGSFRGKIDGKEVRLSFDRKGEVLIVG